MAAAFAKMALKGAAKAAAKEAKGMAKNLAKEAKAELKGAAMAAKNQAIAPPQSCLKAARDVIRVLGRGRLNSNAVFNL